MIKKIYFKLTVFLWLLFNYIITFATVSKSDILPWNRDLDWAIKDTSWWAIDSILLFAKDTIFWVLAVIASWAFVYIGAKLLIARWNPEEFKKTLNYLIYVIVWIVLILWAYLIVSLVSSINLNW